MTILRLKINAGIAGDLLDSFSRARLAGLLPNHFAIGLKADGIRQSCTGTERPMQQHDHYQG